MFCGVISDLYGVVGNLLEMNSATKKEVSDLHGVVGNLRGTYSATKTEETFLEEPVNIAKFQDITESSMLQKSRGASPPIQGSISVAEVVPKNAVAVKLLLSIRVMSLSAFNSRTCEDSSKQSFKVCIKSIDYSGKIIDIHHMIGYCFKDWADSQSFWLKLPSAGHQIHITWFDTPGVSYLMRRLYVVGHRSSCLGTK
jgi:hypothetical protein